MVNLIVALVLFGFLLLIVELFIPGMIVGIIGGLLLGTAVVLGYLEFGIFGGTFLMVGVGLLSLVGFLIWMRIFPKTPIGRRLTLDSVVKGPGEFPDLRGLLGKEGVAVTQLRPAGTALVEGRRVDVWADGSFVEAGKPLRVVHVEGAKVVVRQC